MELVAIRKPTFNLKVGVAEAFCRHFSAIMTDAVDNAQLCRKREVAFLGENFPIKNQNKVSQFFQKLFSLLESLCPQEKSP